MGTADLALRLQQMPIGRGDGDLPGLAADGMHSGVEGRAAGQRRLHRKRTGDHGRGDQVFGDEQPFQTERRRGLRAIQERQPFLRRQRDRLESGDFQSFGPGNPPPAIDRLALAQQHQAGARQGGQIAGGPA